MDSSGFRSVLSLVKFAFGSETVKMNLILVANFVLGVCVQEQVLEANWVSVELLFAYEIKSNGSWVAY